MKSLNATDSEEPLHVAEVLTMRQEVVLGIETIGHFVAACMVKLLGSVEAKDVALTASHLEGHHISNMVVVTTFHQMGRLGKLCAKVYEKLMC